MSKHYRTRASEIWIDDEGIMHVVFNKGAVLDLSIMEETFTLYRDELGLGPDKKKITQMLSGGPITINKAARDLAGKIGADYFIAAAMITDSPLMRFIVNTFNVIQKPGVPFKLFATEEEAMTWLRTFKTQVKNEQYSK